MGREAKEGLEFRPKDGPNRRAARRRWVKLVRKVYPRALTCPRCGDMIEAYGVLP